MPRLLHQQGVALTGRTVLALRAVSAARPPTRPARRRPTSHAFGGRPARPPAGSVTHRRQTTTQTTDAREQNNTGPLGGPVITVICFTGWKIHAKQR